MDPLGGSLLLAVGAALLGWAWPSSPAPGPVPVATSVCAPCPACSACEACWPTWVLGASLVAVLGLGFAAGLCCACCGAATWSAYGSPSLLLVRNRPRDVALVESPERVGAGRSPAAARLRLYD